MVKSVTEKSTGGAKGGKPKPVKVIPLRAPSQRIRRAPNTYSPDPETSSDVPITTEDPIAITTPSPIRQTVIPSPIPRIILKLPTHRYIPKKPSRLSQSTLPIRYSSVVSSVSSEQTTYSALSILVKVAGEHLAMEAVGAMLDAAEAIAQSEAAEVMMEMCGGMDWEYFEALGNVLEKVC